MYDIMEEEVYEFQASELSDEPCFCSQAEFNDKPDSLCFNDGMRKIDFVLVYEDEDKKEFDKRHANQRRKVGFSFLKPVRVGVFCVFCFVLMNNTQSLISVCASPDQILS